MTNVGLCVIQRLYRPYRIPDRHSRENTHKLYGCHPERIEGSQPMSAKTLRVTRQRCLPLHRLYGRVQDDNWTVAWPLSRVAVEYLA